MGFSIVFLILVGLWLATGIYRVNPQEQGVVLRFGEWVRTTEPGLHYHLPSPIEKVITPDVTRENKIEIGYRAFGGGNSSRRDVPDESKMITGGAFQLFFLILIGLWLATGIYRVNPQEQGV